MAKLINSTYRCLLGILYVMDLYDYNKIFIVFFVDVTMLKYMAHISMIYFKGYGNPFVLDEAALNN